MYRNRLLFVALIAIVTSTFPAFARGQSEDPIRQARQLVAENRINEAILLLEQTVRDDPNRIQQAESLLRTIREIRGEYNLLFDRLIDNLVNNPDDIERTLEIIDQMEALDEFPNERVLAQIEDARVVAQLAFDRNLLNERMDEARILIAGEQYDAAIEIYLSLRTLQRDRFDSRGYGDIFIDSVNNAVSDIPGIAALFTGQLPEYQRTGDLVASVASDDVANLDEGTLNPFFSEAERVITTLEQANELAATIAVLKSQVPLQFPDNPIDWYLNFQEYITRGRSEYRDEEGLVYAIETAYQGSMEPLLVSSRERVFDLFSDGDQAVAVDAFDAAAVAYQAAVDASRLWIQSEAVAEGFFATVPEPTDLVEQRAPPRAQSIVSARGHQVAGANLAELARVMQIFVETGQDRQQTLFSLRSQKDSTNGIVNALQSGRTGWESDKLPFDLLPEGYVGPRLAERVESTTELWSRSSNRAVEREQQLVQRISMVQTEQVPDSIVAMREELDAVAPLVTGVDVPIDDTGTGTRFVRYPDEALARFRSVIATGTLRLGEVNAAQEEILVQPEYVLASEGVQEEQVRLDRLETELNIILDAAQTGSTESESLIAQAEALVNTAEARVADMRAAISAFQANAARNNYQALRDAYFDSLELREDPAFRQEVDFIIQQLGDELQELENVIVVRRVRELLTRANELYNQDEFVSARDTLVEAQQTWEQTNVEANAEIDRLLRLVAAALSLEEGRELAITDPLYPILSNYLSIARDDFNRAVTLYNNGQETQAEPLFDRAIENLRNVRDVRPLNWDARIIELRIAQIRNSDDFDSVFASRYEQALGRLSEDGPLAVYSELEVLAEINPDYPGIQNQIRRLEIALNLRPDPVDQARRQQATGLYNRAQALSGGSRDQINVAVSLLEQAVQLNPADGQAAFLLDQLRIQLGGQATVALDTADEQQYRRAETLFSQGQVLQALSVVERLLQDAENQNYPPLVDLRRRIALRLGI